MAGQRRVVGADRPDEAPDQPSARAKKLERTPQPVDTSGSTKVETKGDKSPQEIVIQCPPVSSSRPRSTIQRASTLPSQQLPSSSSNVVQRSRTAPNLDSRSTPSTPKKNFRGQEPANIGRSRVISVSTDGSITDNEDIPSSPATDVSTTLSPTFGRRLPSSPPRKTTPSRPSPPQHRVRGDSNHTSPQCFESGAYGGRHDHQTRTARTVRGSRRPAHTTSEPPSKLATNPSGISVRSATLRGTSRQHQSTKKVVWGSSSTNRPPSIQRGISDPTSHTSHDRSGSRPPPSPGGTSQLTYVSDDGCPASGLTRLTGDSDYYTPSFRDSEMSDADSEPPIRASSSSSKRKGKRRASPPPLPSSNQGSPVQESRCSSPSLSNGPSPRNSGSMSGPSHKKHRGRYSRPPSPRSGSSRRQARDQTPAHDPGVTLGQDVCHCTGPCPSCRKQRFPPFPPQFHPMMFHPAYYPHLFLPPPHMQTGYQLPHHVPPSYPYPYAIPQETGPAPSISSAQPIPPPSGYPVSATLTTHPPTAHPFDAPTNSSPPPAPTSPVPSPAPSTSPPVSSPPLVIGSPQDPPVTNQVKPELLEALDQFYQPPQRSVMVIDQSFDPRSPYSKNAAVPGFSNG